MVMGILNATPDSFSDGGRFMNPEIAVARAEVMMSEGADILDVGGESTRPGSERQSAQIQIGRVVPVIRAIRERLTRPPLISIDTSLSEVATAALDAGADMINDISAGRESPDMFQLAASRGVPIVLMHMQGEPATMQDSPAYEDVVREVTSFLRSRADSAMRAGVKREDILLDPGIGFGKRRQDNLELLGSLNEFVALGYTVLLGASRKRFMGYLCKETEPTELVGATCAVSALGVAAGVRVVRVHDVKANRQSVDIAWALSRLES